MSRYVTLDGVLYRIPRYGLRRYLSIKAHGEHIPITQCGGVEVDIGPLNLTDITPTQALQVWLALEPSSRSR